MDSFFLLICTQHVNLTVIFLYVLFCSSLQNCFILVLLVVLKMKVHSSFFIMNPVECINKRTICVLINTPSDGLHIHCM